MLVNVREIKSTTSQAKEHLIRASTSFRRSTDQSFTGGQHKMELVDSTIARIGITEDRLLWDATAWHSINLLEERGAETVIKLAVLEQARKEGKIGFDGYELMARLCGIDVYGLEHAGTGKAHRHSRSSLAAGAATEIDALHGLLSRSSRTIYSGEKVELNSVPITEFDAWSFNEETCILDIYEIKGLFKERAFMEQMFGMGTRRKGEPKTHCQLEVFENPLKYGGTTFLNAVQRAKAEGGIHFMIFCSSISPGPLQKDMFRGLNLYGLVSRIRSNPYENENIRFAAQKIIDDLQTQNPRLMTWMTFRAERFRPLPIQADGRHVA